VLDSPRRKPFIAAIMMRFRVGPAWALALAGIFAVAMSPDAASAQRRVRITSIDITPSDPVIQVGQPQVFFCNAYDAANNVVPTATCVWRSSNPRAATVDSNGIATGVGVGTTIITARNGTGTTAKTATTTLSVVGAAPAGPAGPAVQPQGDAAAPTTPRPVVGRPTGPGYAAFDRQPDGSGPAEGLVVRPPRVVLVRGESKQLEYNAVRADGENAERLPINFTVAPGGELLVTVDSFGFIRAAGEPGRAIVRAEVPNNARIQARQVAVEVRGDSVRFAR
jgi:hypothetical protein